MTKSTIYLNRFQGDMTWLDQKTGKGVTALQDEDTELGGGGLSGAQERYGYQLLLTILRKAQAFQF